VAVTRKQEVIALSEQGDAVLGERLLVRAVSLGCFAGNTFATLTDEADFMKVAIGAPQHQSKVIYFTPPLVFDGLKMPLKSQASSVVFVYLS